MQCNKEGGEVKNEQVNGRKEEREKQARNLDKKKKEYKHKSIPWIDNSTMSPSNISCLLVSGWRHCCYIQLRKINTEQSAYQSVSCTYSLSKISQLSQAVSRKPEKIQE